MELKEGTLKHLQEYVASKIKQRGFDDESAQERLLLIAEEVGELVNAYRKGSDMYVDTERKITNEVGPEIADVINVLFAFAIEMDIDIEAEFRKKEAVIDQRTYKRERQ